MQAANWSPLNFRQYLKAYYHFTELADGFIGQVLSALRASGHADDTWWSSLPITAMPWRPPSGGQDELVL